MGLVQGFRPVGPEFSTLLFRMKNGSRWRRKVPFFGLGFELAAALSEETITFFVRDSLVRKVQDVVSSITGPRFASIFLELGMFGEWAQEGCRPL